jgi:hypothetical protein
LWAVLPIISDIGVHEKKEVYEKLGWRLDCHLSTNPINDGSGAEFCWVRFVEIYEIYKLTKVGIHWGVALEWMCQFFLKKKMLRKLLINFFPVVTIIFQSGLGNWACVAR